MINGRGRSAQPPRVASWLLNLFARRDQAPPILGDLLEEFSVMALRRGTGSARRWYWRQTAKTLPHLLDDQFRRAPWRNLTAVLTGVLLLRLAATFVVPGIIALLAPYPADWPEPLRLAWLACGRKVPIAVVLVAPMLIGWIVACANETREMVVTIALGFGAVLLQVISAVVHWHLSKKLPVGPFWLYPIGMLASPIAIFIGGLIALKTAPALAQPAVD